MSKESCLEEFKKSSELLLPAYLVIFDLADTRRRNNYLGHDEVDKDIIAFDNFLKNCVSSERCKRIAADIWVACLAEQQLNDIPDLIVNYAQEVPIVLTVWKCRAIDPTKIQYLSKKKEPFRSVVLSAAATYGSKMLMN